MARTSVAAPTRRDLVRRRSMRVDTPSCTRTLRCSAWSSSGSPIANLRAYGCTCRASTGSWTTDRSMPRSPLSRADGRRVSAACKTPSTTANPILRKRRRPYSVLRFASLFPARPIDSHMQRTPFHTLLSGLCLMWLAAPAEAHVKWFNKDYCVGCRPDALDHIMDTRWLWLLLLFALVSLCAFLMDRLYGESANGWIDGYVQQFQT